MSYGKLDMVFRVIITEPARLDAEEIANYLETQSPGTARDWLPGFLTCSYSLKDSPLRRAMIPEARDLELPYRPILYRSHRIIYRAFEDQMAVRIVRVYHQSRKPLESADFDTE